jgi:hypothetical protein
MASTPSRLDLGNAARRRPTHLTRAPSYAHQITTPARVHHLTTLRLTNSQMHNPSTNQLPVTAHRLTSPSALTQCRLTTHLPLQPARTRRSTKPLNSNPTHPLPSRTAHAPAHMARWNPAHCSSPALTAHRLLPPRHLTPSSTWAMLSVRQLRRRHVLRARPPPRSRLRLSARTRSRSPSAGHPSIWGRRSRPGLAAPPFPYKIHRPTRSWRRTRRRLARRPAAHRHTPSRGHCMACSARA